MKIIKEAGIKLAPTLFFFAAHILLGLISRELKIISTLHAYLIFALGLFTVFTNKQVFCTCVIAYLVGAEVFWRMTGAAVFWEFGKYAVIVIAGTAAIVRGKRGRAARSLVFYFLLLLPAILMIFGKSLGQLRTTLSSNLSGPLSILACGMYFSTVVFDKKDLQKALTWCVAPIVAIASVVLLGIKGAGAIKWDASSNLVSSGGFGPNQVCAILGIGAFLCIMLMLLQTKKPFKIAFLVLFIWLFSQAILTLSRGGVIQIVISLGIFFIVLARQRGKKQVVGLFLLAIFLVFFSVYYLLPKLDTFTKGGVTKRYSEKEKVGEVEIYETTGRIELVKADLKVFRNNLFGVGVGNSGEAHREIVEGIKLGTHTEWSRLLAEHGLLGVAAIFLLLLWMKKAYETEKKPFFKGLKASFAVAACFYMTNIAMRTVLPGFLIGFLGAGFEDIEEK